MKKLQRLYHQLLKAYGPQGWWPILNDKTLECEYHIRDYTYPKTYEQRMEICIGAVLAQNTKWQNVVKALQNLKLLNAVSTDGMLNLSHNQLIAAIKPSGFYNQKLRKLKILNEYLKSQKGTPKRNALLELWGIGKETADSILLYAYNLPFFVIDKYTRTFTEVYKLNDSRREYDELRSFFEKNIERDVKVYQEFHALIIAHGKRNFKY